MKSQDVVWDRTRTMPEVISGFSLCRTWNTVKSLFNLTSLCDNMMADAHKNETSKNANQRHDGTSWECSTTKSRAAPPAAVQMNCTPHGFNLFCHYGCPLNRLMLWCCKTYICVILTWTTRKEEPHSEDDPEVQRRQGTPWEQHWLFIHWCCGKAPKSWGNL